MATTYPQSTAPKPACQRKPQGEAGSENDAHPVTRFAFQVFAVACVWIAILAATVAYDEPDFGMACLELATGIFLIAAGAAMWKGSEI